MSLSFRVPPKEFPFLHRKLGGVFVFLAELNTKLDARPLLLRYMDEPRRKRFFFSATAASPVSTSAAPITSNALAASLSPSG